MATRICFISKQNEYPMFTEMAVQFEYYNGFAISQKQRSINALHERILYLDKSLRILEVSTKSTNPVGVALSAFNLMFLDTATNLEYPIENVFQSSKVFEFGGPYRDLLYVQPKDAKRDERLKTSGSLKCFDYNGSIWELEPKTMFYDWLYISSLYRKKNLSEKILKYNAFTDIEFNQERSINCQARSAAIYVSLCKNGMLENAINNKGVFSKIYSRVPNKVIQRSFFD